MASADFDFLSYCSPGRVLMTRDRREARVTIIDRETGIIHGVVRMLGACRWRADGLYLDAPAGAAGPWDLMPPVIAPGGEENRPERGPGVSLAEALRNSEANPGCCD
jgi:hypothetical protein